MLTTDLLTIGQVAARSGVAPSALRHYESQSLLTSARDAAGRRLFPRSVLRRLAFIKAAQAVGLSLSEVREALQRLPQGRTPTKGDWAAVASLWELRLDQQVRALQALKAGLTACIGCGCLSLRTCRLTNPADAAARYGQGAVYLPAALHGSP